MSKSCKLPMKKGQTLTVSAHDKVLLVKRVGGRAWFMKIEGQERARWASFKREACEDIAYFKETGVLPREKVSWA